MDKMSKIEIDGAEYEACPEVAGLLWAVSEERDMAVNHLEIAWALIASANHGDWSEESEEWQASAARWREKYLEIIANRATSERAHEIPCSQRLPLTVAEYLRAYQIPMDAVVSTATNTRSAVDDDQSDTIWWKHPR